MPTYKFANFFDTELLDGVSPSATALMVTPTASQILPIIIAASGVQAQLILWDGVEDPEIVACTVNPQTGTLTVVRGQEGTTARSWPAGTQIMSALTAEVINAALAAYFDINAVLAATFLPLTGGILTGMLRLPATAPTLATHATNKDYVDGILGNKLALSGGTMAGDINMNSNRIFGLLEPIAAAEPATKGYAESYADDLATLILDILDDTNGSLVTTGSATAYVVTTNRVITALTDGLRIVARLHTTSGAAPTLQINATTARPIRTRAGVAVPTAALMVDMPYSFVYSLGNTAWLLEGSVDVLALASATITALTGATATLSGLLNSTSTSHWHMPVGTTAQRPAGALGDVRANSDLSTIDFHTGAAWENPSFAQPVSGLFRSLVVKNNVGTPTTQLDIDADALTVETATGRAYRLGVVDLTINGTINGANGIDVGSTLPAAGECFIFVIYNPTTAAIAGLLSLSRTAPTLPAGYTAKALVSVWWTNASALRNITQRGRRATTVSYSVSLAISTTASLAITGIPSSPMLAAVEIAAGWAGISASLTVDGKAVLTFSVTTGSSSGTISSLLAPSGSIVNTSGLTTATVTGWELNL